MLLEVRCTVKQYLDFLKEAEDAGITPGFEMHGADTTSSFGIYVNESKLPDIEDLDENGVLVETEEVTDTEIDHGDE